MGAFGDLCEIAERNGLHVELVRNSSGLEAIWVLPGDEDEFEVDGVRMKMRVAVVASPFWIGKQLGPGSVIDAEGSAPQLIAMLAERGYS